ncbi:hypothetical protein [Arthrobacter sp. A2-55]|uniref:hypothetical protein n=1 Tax=Arthrobacter sp. A2-55 TaxID=2897337 RepID=UPI0021CDC6F2|nr:hypothetical protein [Arthrobacter sp. A2-55]MCU6479921.1 hypothetical protein [Arthrobacter sp. A2-55]
MMPNSVQQWINDTAYELVGGKRFLLRLAPRIGKSHLVNLLGVELGDSAVIVDGNEFSKLSQTDQRDQLEFSLITAIENHGSAQLVFDSYDRAIESPKGARLQTWLSSRLIDGPYAQDVGALFTARCSTEITRPGAGSPLMSRVTPLEPPFLAPEEANRQDLAQIREWFGESAVLAERALATTSVEPVTIADQFEQDLSFIEDVRKVASTTISRGYLDQARDSFPARCGVYGLLTEAGPTKLLDRLQFALTAKTADDPIWPDNLARSIAKFSQLLAGSHEVIWSDRYMFRDIEPLRTFLKAVTAKTTCRIQLLGGNSVNGTQVSRAELLRLTTIGSVEAKWMSPTDYGSLHDRHVVTGTGGWVVPQVHVIVGRQSPGSTVVAPTASFGVDYHAIWRRSIAP